MSTRGLKPAGPSRKAIRQQIDVASMSPQIVLGLLYARVEGAWLLGDACVTDVMFVFVSQIAPVQFHVNLHDIVRSQSLTMFEADCDVDVFELTLRTKAALRFKALNAMEQRDWADTIDELIAPQCFYPQSMPLTSIRHIRPEVPPKERLPLQSTLIEATKGGARNKGAATGGGGGGSGLLSPSSSSSSHSTGAGVGRGDPLHRVSSTRSSPH